MIKNLGIILIILVIAVFAYFTLNGDRVGELGRSLKRYDWPFRGEIERVVEERRELLEEEAEREKEKIREEVEKRGKSLWERVTHSLFGTEENENKEKNKQEEEKNESH